MGVNGIGWSLRLVSLIKSHSNWNPEMLMRSKQDVILLHHRYAERGIAMCVKCPYPPLSRSTRACICKSPMWNTTSHPYLSPRNNRLGMNHIHLKCASDLNPLSPSKHVAMRWVLCERVWHSRYWFAPINRPLREVFPGAASCKSSHAGPRLLHRVLDHILEKE